MRRGLIRLAVLALILSSTATRAKAAFITFEGQFNTAYNAPITRLGFDIGNPIGQEQHFHEIDSTQFSLPSNGTGILLNDRNTEIFVTLSGGGLFTLNSVDVATALNNSPAVGLMPHPERHVLGTHHPRWTRDGLKPEGEGMAIFRNAVEYFTG